MKRLGILGLLAAMMVLSSPSVTDVQAAGVISGGIKGAVVGGLLGGKRGARIGGVVGAVAGGARQASRNQAYREARARSAYRATAPYRTGVHSNFYVAPPRVIVRPPVFVYPR